MMMSFQYRDACISGESEPLALTVSTSHRPSQSINHILWEKFQIPSSQKTIDRGRLNGLFDRSTKTSSATLISGRAGTGKTEAVAAFARRIGNSIWYSLEPLDADWSIFASHFAAAVIGSETQQSDIFMPDDTAMREPEMERFLASVFSLSTWPELIIIDDIHHVFDAKWFEMFFPLLIRLLPPQTHLFVTCRSKPPAPLWRMRSKQVLNVIDESVLAFDLDETERLYTLLGGDIASAHEAHEVNFGRIGKLVMHAESDKR